MGNRALARLMAQDISVLVNLHERAHDPAQLDRHGLREVHVPVRDFTAPTFVQLAMGVAAVETALATGGRVAIDCGGGVGRTGTLIACYLVSLGFDAEPAIAHVRSGSDELPLGISKLAATNTSRGRAFTHRKAKRGAGKPTVPSPRR